MKSRNRWIHSFAEMSQVNDCAVAAYSVLESQVAAKNIKCFQKTDAYYPAHSVITQHRLTTAARWLEDSAI